jgi:hypothetical protein
MLASALVVNSAAMLFGVHSCLAFFQVLNFAYDAFGEH